MSTYKCSQNNADGLYANGDHGFSLIYTKSPQKRKQPHDLGTWRFQFPSTMLLLRFRCDSAALAMLLLRCRCASLLRSQYDNEDAATLSLRLWRCSCEFATTSRGDGATCTLSLRFLNLFYIKFEVQLVNIQLNVNIQRQWTNSPKSIYLRCNKMHVLF